MVYFLEEPIQDGGHLEARLDIHEEPEGVRICVPLLPPGCSEKQSAEIQRGFLDEILDNHAGSDIVFWYYTPMALRFSAHREPDLCVYDCMDELSAFRGAPPELIDLERQLFDLADLVFTGGQSLYEAKRARHPSVHALPSSIDKAHFGQARKVGLPEPPDQQALPRPRIGFFGVVDERMDTGLVDRIAELRPDWQIVMLGPVVKIDPATLPRKANLHWLGSKSYGELPGYLAGWNAGFMPFALNEATRFISPTKTPEFLAAGVPVVSTAIRDVQKPYGTLGLVEIARTGEEFVQALERVMHRAPQEWRKAVDRHLADMSWDQSWAAMALLMRTRLLAGAPASLATTTPTTDRKGAAHV
ncbi:glycosyltransferase family protein [Teichococcus vastitatis]|nr:glycosyltransferase family 1 protein [Pseudoroseomonas vastitatis]